MEAYEEAMNALGEPTRRRIFEQLADGPKSVGVLATTVPVSRPAVSQHLRVLRSAGLVGERPDGTRRIYHVEPAGIEALRAYFDDFWDRALTAFQSEAEARERSKTMSTTEALAAIRKTITVDASLETAFETFTHEMSSWWPTGSHRIFEDRSEVVFETRAGGRVYERNADGQEGDWADVLVWEPPNRFVLGWRVNPKRGPTEVEVRFSPVDGRTRVDLEHRGWDDPEGRANYDTGWDFVLERFRAAFQSVSE